MKQTLLLDREDIRSVEEALKYKFTRSILLSMDLPTEDILPEYFDEFSVEQKIKLRTLLNKYNLTVINQDDEIKVFVDKELIGHWKKPTWVMKTDLSVLDPTKKIYIEMTIDFWSVFEEQNE